MLVIQDVMRSSDQLKARVIATVITWRERFALDARYFVLLRCVIRVMGDLVDAGLRD